MKILRWRDIAGDAAFHAARTTLTPRTPVLLHGHDFAEVFWIEGGAARHLINGREVSLAPGVLVMMRPEDRHAIEPEAGATVEVSNIAFPRKIHTFLGRRYFAKRNWGFWAQTKTPFLVKLAPDQLRQVNRRADTLGRSPRTRLYIERFLLDLLTELLPHPAESLHEKAPVWLVRALEEIEQPANFAAGTEAFFRAAGRSREHVSRTCRACLGATPTDYVNRVRMAYAARQLEMSGAEILEIAAQCGLENLGHFYRLFRAAHGMTPRAYRLTHRRLL